MAALGLFIAWLVERVYSAWMMRLLWGWFVVPLGFPRITMAWAIGLDALVTWLVTGYADVYWTMRTSAHRRADEYQVPTSTGIGASFVLTTLCLVYGVVTHWLMLHGW